MKRRAIASLAFGAFLVVGAAQQRSSTPEALLGRAIHQEQAEGDLEAAIASYKEFVAHNGDNRPLAAKALLGMGGCYEKLGKAEARKAYQRVVTEYADQGAAAAQARLRLAALTKPAGPTVAGMQIRRVWRGPDDMLSKSQEGDVCSDGSYLTFYERRSRSLMVLDLATGESRRLVQGGSPEHQPHRSRVSPDCTQIAYEWDGPGGDEELRLIGIDGSGERLLYRNQEMEHIHPRGWLPDGKHIVVATELRDRTIQIAVVSVADGSMGVLKSLDWQQVALYSSGMAVSPDGRYVAYDFRPEPRGPHDITLLAIDGSGETSLVTHPADDDVVGWAPDGKGVLFRSDRTGNDSLWWIQVADGKPQGAPQLLKKDLGRITSWGVTRKGALYYARSDEMKDGYVATLDLATGKLLTPPRRVDERAVGMTMSPAWSPDGNSLAYISLKGAQLAITIRSLETDKTSTFSPEVTVKAGGPHRSPLQWSPTGSSVLFVGVQQGLDGAYQLDVQTGKVTALVPGRHSNATVGRTPTLSPDGKVLFYSYYSDMEASWLLSRSLETGEEAELYHPPVSPPWIGPTFALSPDGRYVAFFFPHSSSSSALHVVPAGGGKPRELLSVKEPEYLNWGMHLTPEAPRSSIRALEDYSRTLGSFKSASPSGFKVNRCRPPAGRNERRL